LGVYKKLSIQITPVTPGPQARICVLGSNIFPLFGLLRTVCVFVCLMRWALCKMPLTVWKAERVDSEHKAFSTKPAPKRRIYYVYVYTFSSPLPVLVTTPTGVAPIPIFGLILPIITLPRRIIP